MKKWYMILFFLGILCFIVGGCSKTNEIYDVERNNQNYKINTKDRIITVNSNHYAYKIEDNTLEISYPDGTKYWSVFDKLDGSFSGSGWSDNYKQNEYVSGEVLTEVLEKELLKNLGKESPWKSLDLLEWIILIAWFVLGIWMCIFPYAFWKIRVFGWVRNGEPTDFVLGEIQVVGVVFLICLGLLWLFYLC